MSSALQVINTAPSADDFESLESHQSQTPGTFFGGKPVLHYHNANASLNLSEEVLKNNSAFSVLRSPDAGAGAGAGAASTTTNGDGATPEVTVAGIDVWVTSESFALWSSAAGKGVQIPYPIISLHARQQTALYMQLCLSEISQTADDDLETVELLLQPSSPDSSATDAAEALYAAVSACADLHPDPDSDDEQEAEPEPGAGGWITSDNMHEFVDENGNFRMPETTLGAGAGSVRTADQFADDDDGEDTVDGDGGSDETKWRRTE